jgi:hypothetical protein
LQLASSIYFVKRKASLEATLVSLHPFTSTPKFQTTISLQAGTSCRILPSYIVLFIRKAECTLRAKGYSTIEPVPENFHFECFVDKAYHKDHDIQNLEKEGMYLKDPKERMHPITGLKLFYFLHKQKRGDEEDA